MTTREQEPVENQEARVWGLRDEIIGKLKTRGGDPTALVHQMEKEMIRVASNQDIGGESALILHIDGRWGTKFDMYGYEIENPTIPELLREYATVQDKAFKALLLRPSRDPKLGSLMDHELTQYYEKQEEEEQRYVEENKPRLLHGFIKNLEGALQTL